jgi:hypothetical protein
MPHSLDFLALVPHDPLRMAVMGERALAQQAATAGRHRRDAACCARRCRPAPPAFPPAAPTTTAPPRPGDTGVGSRRPNSQGLGAAFQGLGHGVVQMVSDFDLLRGPSVSTPSSTSSRPRARQRPAAVDELDAARPRRRPVAGDAGPRRGRRGTRPAAVPAGRAAWHRRHHRSGRQLPPLHGLSGLQGRGPPAAGRARRGAARARRARRASWPSAANASGRRRHADAAAGGHPAGAHRAASAAACSRFQPGPDARLRAAGGDQLPGVRARQRGCTALEALYDHFAEGDGSNAGLLPDLQLQRRQPGRGAPDAGPPARCSAVATPARTSARSATPASAPSC